MLPPGGPLSTLRGPARLASWDRSDHPSQVALWAYLEGADRLLEGRHGISSPWSVELCVGVPEGVNPLRGGDLDNYLYPIANHLGWRSVDSAHARKGRGPSTIRLGTCLPRQPGPPGWSFASAETHISAEKRKEWRSDVEVQLLKQTWPVITEPVELHLCLRLGGHRNWVWLWKQAIDSLIPILGADPLRARRAPLDDRIVSLGLHRLVDESLGNAVQLGVWWRAAPEGWDVLPAVPLMGES